MFGSITKNQACFFSPNTEEELKTQIQGIFGIDVVTNPEKYLGLPTLVGKGKRRTFKEVVDRVHAKITRWSKRLLSIGGKEAFIKVVLQAVPMYTMQCFLLSKMLCQDITKVIRKFWWQSQENGKGLCWMKWGKICTPKAIGGIGFRDLHLFNKALIAKQGWRLMNHTDTLCYRVMKARYFPNTDFMNAKL